MTITAAICYVIALVAELAGIGLLVAEAKKARAAMIEWRVANPEHHSEGSFGQQVQINGLMELLLGNDRSRRTAIGLLILGVLVGAAGNFLSLSW